jgi:hypothetical protein
MALLVHEVIEKANKARSKDDKVKVLRDNESWALKDILRGTFETTLEWNLPGGEPPWTPCEPHNAPTNLLKEHKQFVYFVKGLRESNRLLAAKRESIFIGLIEGIDPNDARLVINMINKEKPKGISRPVVEEAFPGLLQD